MPVIRYKTLPGATQADVDLVANQINSTTAPSVIPRATVTFDSQSGEKMVEVGLPFDISAADLLTAQNAINDHSKTAFSGTFPSVVVDEDFEALTIGSKPTSLSNRGFELVVVDPTEWEVDGTGLVQSASADDGVIVDGTKRSFKRTGSGLEKTAFIFSVPQQDINGILAFEFSALAIGTSRITISPAGGGFITFFNIAVDDWLISVSEGMTGTSASYNPVGGAPGGKIICGVTESGDVFGRMISDLAGTTDVTASQPLGFVGPTSFINIIIEGTGTLDDMKLVVKTGT